MRGPGRAARLARRLARRRDVRVAAVLLAAAVAVPLLRSGVEGPVGPARSGPTPAASVRPAPVSPVPAPPYDRLPGRTAIPVPVRSGWALAGVLPPIGPAGKETATRAGELVLGRYCFDPGRYTLNVTEDDPSWRRAKVSAVLIERGGAGPVLPLWLTWTGSAYAWLGPPSLSAGC